jgi:hypothetical protein
MQYNDDLIRQEDSEESTLEARWQAPHQGADP